MRLQTQMSYLHGRDPDEPGEREFMFTVLQFGGGDDQKAKVVIMKELNDILIAAAKDWTWIGLNKKWMVQVIRKVCEYLGIRLTKRKLMQIIPVIGAGVGAGG